MANADVSAQKLTKAACAHGAGTVRQSLRLYPHTGHRCAPARLPCVRVEEFRSDLALLGIHHDVFASEAELQAAGKPAAALQRAPGPRAAPRAPPKPLDRALVAGVSLVPAS